MNKTLIVYYSWSNGNTERIAQMIQSELKCDIVKIQTKVPYPDDYDYVVKKGKEEVDSGYKPKILNIDISNYDTIILGTPTWWYTMAPAVLTFVESHLFENKTVIPFQTHGGWPGHVLKDIEVHCKGAKCCHEYAIQFDSDGKDHLITEISDIQNWIQSMK